MITTSNEFLKSFLWKYVDMTINKYEHDILLSKFNYKNTDLYPFFKGFNIFTDEQDICNYIFVISSIETYYLERFLIFYITNVRFLDLDKNPQKINTMEAVIEYIGNNEEKFKLFLISLYFFF